MAWTKTAEPHKVTAKSVLNYFFKLLYLVCKMCVCVLSLQLCLTLCNPTLLCPWDSPGKEAGVGCHALLILFYGSLQIVNGFIWLSDDSWHIPGHQCSRTPLRTAIWKLRKVEQKNNEDSLKREKWPMRRDKNRSQKCSRGKNKPPCSCNGFFVPPCGSLNLLHKKKKKFLPN